MSVHPSGRAIPFGRHWAFKMPRFVMDLYYRPTREAEAELRESVAIHAPGRSIAIETALRRAVSLRADWFELRDPARPDTPFYNSKVTNHGA